MATEINELQNTVKAQEAQIKQLKQAIVQLERRLIVLSKQLSAVKDKTRSNSHELANVTRALKQRD